MKTAITNRYRILQDQYTGYWRVLDMKAFGRDRVMSMHVTRSDAEREVASIVKVDAVVSEFERLTGVTEEEYNAVEVTRTGAVTRPPHPTSQGDTPMTATTTRPLTTHAAAAKAIRRDLKAACPTTKFTVRSDSYAGGNSVRVAWIDGPTTTQVDAIVAPYQECSFDGMQDLKEYTNRRDDLPQVDWVLTERRYSREATATAVAFVNDRWGLTIQMHPDPAVAWVDEVSNSLPHPSGRGWAVEEIRKALADFAFMPCTCGTTPEFSDAYCAECGHQLRVYAV